MSETKRLTADEFAAMLDRHPDFDLRVKSFRRRFNRPCGGCAMSLVYHDAHPDARLPEDGMDDREALDLLSNLQEYCHRTFGADYVNDFIDGFDNAEDVDLSSDPQAITDGHDCRERAIEMGRLDGSVV